MPEGVVLAVQDVGRAAVLAAGLLVARRGGPSGAGEVDGGRRGAGVAQQVDLGGGGPGSAAARLAERGQPDEPDALGSESEGLGARVVRERAGGDRGPPAQSVGAEADAVLTDAPVGPVGAGTVDEGGDDLGAVHVDGDAVRQRGGGGSPLAVPEGGGVPVEDVGRAAVLGAGLLVARRGGPSGPVEDRGRRLHRVGGDDAVVRRLFRRLLAEGHGRRTGCRGATGRCRTRDHEQRGQTDQQRAEAEGDEQVGTAYRAVKGEEAPVLQSDLLGRTDVPRRT